MKFSKLKQAHTSYINKYKNDEVFNEYKEKDCWNFTNLDEEIVEKDILGFLNKWKCRIPCEIKADLMHALMNISENFQYFKGKLLWEHFNIKNKEQKQHLKVIFNVLGSVNQIGSVVISKIMHMFNPNFFIMWENQIRNNYGFSANAEGYINFLQKIKSEILENKLLDYYNKNDIKNEVTLLKLIDEYNMEKMR